MTSYSPPAGGDYYDDSPMPPKPDAAPEETREHQDDQATAVLPKSFFQGKDLKPGTECNVRVERVMDDEVMVSYVPHEGDSEDNSTEAPPEPPAAAPEPSMMD